MDKGRPGFQRRGIAAAGKLVRCNPARFDGGIGGRNLHDFSGEAGKHGAQRVKIARPMAVGYGSALRILRIRGAAQCDFGDVGFLLVDKQVKKAEALPS